MRALVLDSACVELKSDYPVPEPGRGESLIRVLRAGICETDLQLIDGYMQFQGVLGHEFVGVAEDGPYRGERVVGEINCSCHQCESCRNGLANHCPHRSVLGILNHDGAFADYIAVPDRNLHRVPDEIPTEHAVFTEPLAAAFQIPTQLELTTSQRILVLGDGRLGNLCAQVLKLSGCRVTVIGKHPAKLALLERLGMDVRLLDETAADRSFDVVVDCTGSASGLPVALGFVRPRGTIVLKTTVAPNKIAPSAGQIPNEPPRAAHKQMAPAGNVLDHSAVTSAGQIPSEPPGAAHKQMAPAGNVLDRSAVTSAGQIPNEPPGAVEQPAIWFAQFVIDEIRLVGSRCGPFDRALQALNSKHIEVKHLVTARYSLSEAVSAIERARSSESLKVLLDAEQS